MQNKDSAILVVGSDSLVGSALIAHLKKHALKVVGTTRRPEAVSETNIYLDLSENMNTWQCTHPVRVAVICAGVTRLDTCENDAERSACVNVDGISALVKNLIAKGIFVVYLSTNQVFDGLVPHREPDSPLSPITEYGRQKAEAERRLSECGDSVTIVRFTKILGEGNPLFAGWIETLKDNKEVSPFSDMCMAPIPVSWAASILYKVIEEHLLGILQVSGESDVSYADAAYRGASLFGIDPQRIRPIKACQSKQYTGSVPKHTTLNTTRLKRDLGVTLPDVWWTIEKAFVEPRALSDLNQRIGDAQYGSVR